MTYLRRQLLQMGGGALATLMQPAILCAAPLREVEMRGTGRGEQVWFRPHGLAVARGTTVRFINRDPGNSHTATAYHPDNFDRARRIPKTATTWDSDFLLPNDSYEVVLSEPGVYDYFCIPHEMAGMVGRIVVGTPSDPGWEGPSRDTSDVSEAVLGALPSVEDILNQGQISREDAM